MNAHDVRREQDLARLREFEREFASVLTIKMTSGNPVSVVEVEILLQTPKDSKYPEVKQLANTVQIELPVRYPFEPPKVTVRTPIWNPNIFPSGLICLGQKWIPTQNLALLVQRVMQILVLDPSVINTASPANGDAARWYTAKTRTAPTIFPTVRLDSLKAAVKAKITWKSLS